MRLSLAQYCEGSSNTTGEAQESRAEQYHLRRIGLGMVIQSSLAVGALNGFFRKCICYRAIGNSLFV